MPHYGGYKGRNGRDFFTERTGIFLYEDIVHFRSYLEYEILCVLFDKELKSKEETPAEI